MGKSVKQLRSELASEQHYTHIAQHPLSVPEKIDMVVTNLPKKKNDYYLTNRIPMIEMMVDEVEMDVVNFPTGGMTPAASANTSTSVYSEYSMGKRSWEPGHFREKTRIDESHLKNLRKIGSNEDYETAERLFDIFKDQLRVRMANNLEWQRSQGLFEQTLTVTTASNNTISVPIPKPAFLRPTTMTSWDAAGATPLDDLDTWIADLSDFSPYKVQEIQFGHRCLQRMALNDQMVKLRENNLAVFDKSIDARFSLINTYIGNGIRLLENSDRITMHGVVTAAVAAGGSTITVDRAFGLEVGASILTAQMTSAGQQQYDRLVVDTITDNGDGTWDIDITGTTAVALTAGDFVQWNLYTIPTEKIWISALLEDHETYDGLLSTNMLQNPISFVSCRSFYPGLFQRPQTGVWGFALPPKTDPPAEEYVVGCTGLIHIAYPMAWSTPTVFT